MCMWQSHAFAGALSFGASLPEEFGTACWAKLCSAGVATAAVKAAAPLRNVRRAIASRLCMAEPPTMTCSKCAVFHPHTGSSHRTSPQTTGSRTLAQARRPADAGASIPPHSMVWCAPINESGCRHARSPLPPRARHSPRPRADGDERLRASARVGHDDERARLRGRRLGHRRAACVDVRRHVLGLRNAGPQEREEGRLQSRRARPARRGQRELAQGIRLLHLRQNRRQEDDVRRSQGLLSRLQGFGAHAALRPAVRDAREGQGARSRDLRSELLRRFHLPGKGRGQARRRPGPVRLRGEEADQRRRVRPGQQARRGVLQPGRLVELRRDVRQQDFSEVSIRHNGASPGICVMRSSSAARVTRGGLAVLAILAIVCLVAAADPSCAQTNPFGGPRAPVAPPAPPPASDTLTWLLGKLGLDWVLAKQAEYYRQFAGLIRAAKADGSAVWSLLGVSFLYGIFHAAGPGHGKAVISSYLVANEETWRRGVVLSFASALLHALVAVAVVGIAAVLLNATASTMKRAVDVIEIVSYALIILIGLRLLWGKGRGFITALR